MNPIIPYSLANDAYELAKKNGIVQWSASTNYQVDKFVIYNNKLYKCITTHTSTSTFDATKFQFIGSFSNMKVGENTLTGDIEIEAGTGIDLQVDTNNNKITVLSKGYIGSKQVDETNLADKKVISYNASKGKYELVDAPTASTIQDVGNFTSTVNAAGTQITLNWTNPASMVKRELYVSTTNILNADRNTCNSIATLLDAGVGSGVNNADSFIFNSTPNTMYYFKIFVEQDIIGMQLFSNGKSLQQSSNETIPPGDVSGLSAQPGNAKVTLKWTDPTDSDWAGTKVVRKVGSYPNDENDGVLVVNSTVRNQYQTNGYQDVGLTNEVQVYYQLFSYDVNGNINRNAINQITSKPSSDTTPPADVTGIIATPTDTSITIKWTDPSDSDWNRTILVRKVGSYPIDENDGTIIVSSTVRNQYQSTGFVDTNVVTGTTYYYQLFPIDIMGNVNRNTNNRFNIKAQTPPSPWGVAWNKTADTYARLGKSLTDGVPILTNSDTYSSTNTINTVNYFNTVSPWKDMRRCNLSDTGVVNAYYGDPTYKDDGTNGQVMVEIPKFAYKLVTTANEYEFWIGDASLAGMNGFVIHPAFYRDRDNDGVAEEVDKRYFSAYEGYNNIGKLESKSGVVPTQSQNISTFRTQAQARGNGWGITDFNLLFAVQLLYLVEYGHFDSQTKIGKGLTSGSGVINTGTTTSLGNQTGNQNNDGTSGTKAMSYRGIENLYGNTWKWIDGLITGTNQIKIGNKEFNDTGTGYVVINKTFTNSSGYCSDIWGDSTLGFIGKTFSGSSSTKLYDYSRLISNALPYFGGRYGDATVAGVFCLDIGYSASSTSWLISARLTY